MGKVCLAELDDARVRQLLSGGLAKLAPGTIADREELIRSLGAVRERGFATSEDELEESLHALAVPDRRLTGLLAVTGPTPRMVGRDPRELASQLDRTAQEIAAVLADQYRPERMA